MEELEQKIKRLQDEVRELTTNTTETTSKVVKKKDNHFDILNLPIVSYVVLPFVIMVLLFAFKPYFIFEDVIDSTNVFVKKISYKKLIVATIVCSALLKTISIIGVLVYKNRIVK